MNNALLLILSGSVGAALVEAIGGVLQFFLGRKAKKEDTAAVEETAVEKRLSAVEAALMAILLDRIQYLCRVYIKDGSVDADDLRRLNIMHERYHDEGGNGDLDRLMERVNSLPLK